VTVFALDKGMDTGPIYTNAQLAIDPTWRAGELMEALAQMGPDVVEAALAAIAAIQATWGDWADAPSARWLCA
ncbi:MAG: hypothetical protein EBW05_03710, partial [Betaproteobacteria bacterium]|nr:hypothetical protein [Betaproteobacteria bacterium]